MHSYSSHYKIRETDHPSLKHHTLKCMDPLFECLSTWCWPVELRYVVTVMTMLGISSQYMQRMCLSIVITEMVDETSRKTSKGSSCPDLADLLKQNDTKGDTFEWSVEMEGEILASFYYGYILTQIPGGIVADMWGGKHIFGGAVLLTSLCSVLTPLFAKWHPIALLLLRVVMGLGQGALFPAVTSLVAHWAPPDERAFMNTITNSGVPAGLVFGYILSGTLIAFVPPWDNVFYIYGAMGGLWWIFWWVLVSPTPANHPFMKEEEREYILDSIYGQSRAHAGKIPWLNIFKSAHFWLIVIANFGHEWLLFYVSTELPIYLDSVERLPIGMNGVASALPFVSMWIGSMVFGELDIWLEKKHHARKSIMRRIFAVVANIVPSVIIVGSLYVGCKYWTVVGLMSATMFFKGSIFVSVRCSCLDITKNFAGIIMSLVSEAAGLAGFTIPLFVHSVIGEGTRVSDWQLPVYSCFVFGIAFTIPYLIFISTEIQPWDEGRHVQIIPPTRTPSIVPARGATKTATRSSISGLKI